MSVSPFDFAYQAVVRLEPSVVSKPLSESPRLDKSDKRTSAFRFLSSRQNDHLDLDNYFVQTG